MMTPQEVANCTFAKSMMGGYNMASVDDFLDKLTEDYAGLYKENAALKAKLKVTVDKMAEYREEQDAIRTTLLTAQKMASAMRWICCRSCPRSPPRRRLWPWPPWPP